jgi:hypothetical protein
MPMPEASLAASPPDHSHSPSQLGDPAREATAAVHVGLWVSATRCVLTYVVAPVAGAIGIFLGPLGLLLQIAGAVTASSGAHRLWSLHHRLRLPYVALALSVDLLAVIALLELIGLAPGQVLR